MAKVNRSLNEVLKQVPADYYHRGVKSNLLQRYWHQKKWRILKEFMGKTSGSLLDIGCADGTTTAQIQKLHHGLKITAIDYYQKAIKYAKATNQGINFLVADAHKLPFKNRSFDTVTAIEVLEHLDNPEKSLLEIYRVLKNKGQLIVIQDTDSLLFKLVWWFWTKWKGSVWNGSHINCYSPKKLIRLIKQTGFKVKQSKYTNFKMEIFIKAQKT
ncbi:MAG: Methyltransferase domain protein [Candidatus Curtissbacteria bacterium GW2011_GWC2_38_9]|uniref:Methyltransferase type 11 domain-containing protein n=3 Tax=Candidatus Curtissiibacteriota TaxID=1752717 RepID=A0A1F5HPN7_9BACT|nr:MAG: Methyltransferase domain protein [Candidatus Curtissbacteria bacterium GW2011_GWC2_38_9]KKS04434.1 MAG: Methyltransferase domain protein [Candidatus Curtissbacteria bacterium GW2011_GWA2_41_24]OGD89603.1 MAG: hypothetical protein A2Z54_01825 [Candidatus Curtissbacteria bacterium RIFCSPHIGHO2_02_39_8]OGE06096.1 MAG: hypothetical protein A2W70_05115 [Candidatus Curtissbacteria bacterium RIFCSPLOWO2_02_41_11]